MNQRDMKEILKSIASNSYSLNDIPKELLSNKEFILLAIEKNYIIFKYASEELRSDKEYVLKVIEKEPYLFKYVSEELKKDKEIVLKVIEEAPYMFQYASEEIRGDKEIVLKVIEKAPYMFQYASEEIRGDKEIVLKVIDKNPYMFQYASKEIREDKEIILLAIEKSAIIFEYALEEIRADKEFVLKAIEKNSYTFEYASEEIRADKEVVLKVIKKNASMFKYASEDIMLDKEFVLQVIDKNPVCIQYVPSSLLSDEEKMTILKNSSHFMNYLYLLPEDIDEYINNDEFDMSKLIFTDNIKRSNSYSTEFLKKMSKNDIESFNVVLEDCSSSSIEKYKKIKEDININKIYDCGYGCSEQEFEQVLKKLNEIKESVDVPLDNDEQRDYKIFSQIYVMLSKNIVYDYDVILPENRYNKDIENECRNLYGGLVKGKAVCAGYANILKQVLSQYNIKCEYIISKAHEGVAHAYNQVFIDGQWYNCDLTSDSSDIMNNCKFVWECLQDDQNFGVNVKVDHTSDMEVHECSHPYKQEINCKLDQLVNEISILKGLNTQESEIYVINSVVEQLVKGSSINKFDRINSIVEQLVKGSSINKFDIINGIVKQLVTDSIIIEKCHEIYETIDIVEDVENKSSNSDNRERLEEKKRKESFLKKVLNKLERKKFDKGNEK